MCVFLHAGLADLLAICYSAVTKSAYLEHSVAFWLRSLNIGFVNLCLNIGFVNLCCHKQDLQILSLFTIEMCIFNACCCILGP